MLSVSALASCPVCGRARGCDIHKHSSAIASNLKRSLDVRRVAKSKDFILVLMGAATTGDLRHDKGTHLAKDALPWDDLLRHCPLSVVIPERTRREQEFFLIVRKIALRNGDHGVGTVDLQPVFA